MKRSGLIAFFVLVFLAAWGLAALFVVFPARMTAWFGPITLWNPVVFLTVWAPTILAFILALLFDGVAGLKEFAARTFRWRFALRWYVLSTVGVAALCLAARFVQASFHSGTPPPVLDFASWPYLAWYGVTMMVIDPGPIGEDPGWRGFALPRMLNEFSPAVAATVLGIIWGIWHLPAFLFSGMPQAELPVGWFLLWCTSMTVVMSWISINARGAVLPAILVHWAANRFSDLSSAGAMYCALAWALTAVVIIVATRGRLSLPPRAVRLRAAPQLP